MNLKKFIFPVLNMYQAQWKKDRDGEFIELQTKQFMIQIEPFAYIENNIVFIEMSYSFSHIELARIANLIMGDNINNFISIHYKQIELTGSTNDVKNIIEKQIYKIIDEANHYQLNEIIDKYKSNYYQRPSIEQILHLSVLVLLKDFPTLIDYYQAMKNGNNIGFVPMITMEMIDNAINLALA